MAYYAKGDRTLAAQSLRKSLELDPSFEGSQEARNILK
jgi:Tfp pilus assembly protein PilF